VLEESGYAASDIDRLIASGAILQDHSAPAAQPC
jgi:hypothetical protein